MTSEIHPPGRRRLRSAVSEDGYETWTIQNDQYEVLRNFILEATERLDEGEGALLKDLIWAAEIELAGHPLFPSGRFTNWIRFVKVDLECEGVVERVGTKSPQRLQLKAS